MGVYLCRREGDSVLAVWRCDESLEELTAAIPFPQSVLSEAERFRAQHRREEWLAVRALFYTVMGRYVPIRYESSGKPCLEEGYISISHTKGYVAVAYSRSREVAVDIEQYGERVVRVAPRFMNPAEDGGGDVWSLLLHWSAKETVYKLVGDSAVDFAHSIIVRPFRVGDAGVMSVSAQCPGGVWRVFPVRFVKDPDFVLTYIS
jgi:phosphopantetheinyl transferase